MSLLPIMAADQSGAVILLNLIIGIVGFVLAIAWIVFPFIVISKCNEMIKLLRTLAAEPEFEFLKALSEESARTRAELEQLRSQVDSIHEGANEISTALQWMIDNWRERQGSG